MADYAAIWKPHAIVCGETINLSIGSLNLWIHRGKQDWHIANELEQGVEERCSVNLTDDPFEPDRDWARWVLNENVDKVRFLPKLPDRPVIVRPEMPMCLMPKQSIQLFISIPIWLTIVLGGRKEQVEEVPSMKLSNSWFGTFTEGELCYALKTTARLHHDELRPAAHRAVFPIEIKNASTEKLNFERLCLRPQFLNIYQGKSRLWTSKGRVSYRGEDKWSRIVYSTQPPGYDQATELLGKARETVRHGALLNTFDSLKQRVDI